MSKGDFTPGKTVGVKFNTHLADGTPTTLSGTPAVSVYKRGSTTESTAGVTLTVDYDARTGLNDVAIDTSADGTFYAAGNDYDVVITAGTVNSISVVGTVVGSFSLSNREAAPRSGSIGVTSYSTAAWQNLVARIDITGSTTPATNDTYIAVDFLNGRRYYKSTSLGTPIYLWWDGNSKWTLSTAVGVNGSAYFTLTATQPDGAYIPQGTASQTVQAVATEAGGVILADYQYHPTFEMLDVTGTTTLHDGLVVSRSTLNGDAVTFSGNGFGKGLVVNSGGSGLVAFQVTASGTNADAIKLSPTGTGLGINGTLGALSTTERAAIATATWANSARTLTAFSFSLTTTVGGYATNQDPATLVWGAATSSFNGAGTFGAAVQASGSSPSVIAAAVWDLATAGHTGTGSFGAAMSAAGTAADPWTGQMNASTTYGVAFRRIAALLGGKLVEDAVHGTSTFYDMGDPTTVVMTSTQSLVERDPTFRI